VGNAQIISECKGFEDTRSWTFFESMTEARAYLSAKNQGNRFDGDVRPMSVAPAAVSA
jgi:hypothetical protein